MKTLSVAIPISDEDAVLLASKFQVKEIEGLVIREGLHAIGALINEIRSTIPYVEHDVIEE